MGINTSIWGMLGTSKHSDKYLGVYRVLVGVKHKYLGVNWILVGINTSIWGYTGYLYA